MKKKQFIEPLMSGLGGFFVTYLFRDSS